MCACVHVGVCMCVCVCARSGMNSIVVVPGANSCLSPDDVTAAGALICSARVLLCQFEVPLATVKMALQLAKRFEGS